MVTRVYNAFHPPYLRPQGVGGRPPVQPAGQSEEEKKPAPDFSQQGFNGQQPSRGLATVSEQAQRNRIQLTTILQDFRSTVDTLDTGEQVRNEVNTYLNAVSLQSEKPSPSVPFIRQGLKTAAITLDESISRALGYPSKVVHDWVEALLLQNIDYRSTGQTTAKTAPETTASPEMTTASDPAVSSNPPAPSIVQAERQQLRQWVEEGRARARANQPDQALVTFNRGLELLKGKDRPDLAGRLYSLMGQTADRAGLRNDALDYYRLSDQAFGQADLPGRQAKPRYARALLLDEQGHLPEARSLYESAISLQRGAGHSPLLARMLNDLGVLQLRQSNPGQAATLLNEAAGILQADPAVDPSLLADVHSNLGALYRFRNEPAKALTAYRASLALARQGRDRIAYGRTLGSLAALYAEQGRPKQAAQLSERAAGLLETSGSESLSG